MKYKAVFEVEFDLDDMISKQDLEEDWNDDLLNFMQNLYESEGIGVFDNDVKLVDIKQLPTKLYNLPEHKNIKLYLDDDNIVIFDHLDGMYSYCWLEDDKNRIININVTVDVEEYRDGYKIKEEE